MNWHSLFFHGTLEKAAKNNLQRVRPSEQMSLLARSRDEVASVWQTSFRPNDRHDGRIHAFDVLPLQETR